MAVGQDKGAFGPVLTGVRMVAALLEGGWALVFGPPDLGPVDFATLTRRRTPNDALVAPEGLCRHAEADRIPPAFPALAGPRRAERTGSRLSSPLPRGVCGGWRPRSACRSAAPRGCPRRAPRTASSSAPS